MHVSLHVSLHVSVHVHVVYMFAPTHTCPHACRATFQQISTGERKLCSEKDKNIETSSISTTIWGQTPFMWTPSDRWVYTCTCMHVCVSYIVCQLLPTKIFCWQIISYWMRVDDHRVYSLMMKGIMDKQIRYVTLVGMYSEHVTYVCG